MKVIRHIPGILTGLTLGFLLSVAIRCWLAWYHGGSPDPRCVYDLGGYVEVRVLGLTAAQDRVTCEYRPEVGAK
jgi:hypothetical protein